MTEENIKHTIKLTKSNLTVDIEEDKLGVVMMLYNKKNGNIVSTTKVFNHEIKSLKKVGSKHVK